MKSSKSVLICYGITWVVIGVLAGLCVTAPMLMDLYMRWRALAPEVCRAVLIAFYLSCLPAFTALICLLRILHKIRVQEMFGAANRWLLRVISWCCLAVALICFVAGFWYFPLFFLTAAMLFISLITRVVCTCFLAAAELQEENSLTI